MRRKMTDAHSLRAGAELETEYDETLTVTDRNGDQITWEVDGEYTETFSVDEVQRSLDDGTMEVVATAGNTTNADTDAERETEPVSNTAPSDLDDSDLYIRFGNIPDDERSYDNRNDVLEAGVSVYDCKRDTIESDADTSAAEAYYITGTMLQTVFTMLHRPIYLVTGDQVGTGADGEPVLEDVEVVAELTTPKGTGGFVSVRGN